MNLIHLATTKKQEYFDVSKAIKIQSGTSYSETETTCKIRKMDRFLTLKKKLGTLIKQTHVSQIQRIKKLSLLKSSLSE